jgi:hypothetical protein
MDTLQKYEFFAIMAFTNGVMGMLNLLGQGFNAEGLMVICIAIACQLVAGTMKDKAMLIRIIKRAGKVAEKSCEPGFTKAQYRQAYQNELEILLEEKGYENPRQLARELVQGSSESSE